MAPRINLTADEAAARAFAGDSNPYWRPHSRDDADGSEVDANGHDDPRADIPPVDSDDAFETSGMQHVSVDLREKPQSDQPVITPLECVDASSWEGKPVPQQKWLVRNRIPVGKPVLLTGDGSAGKTTIAGQLAVSVRLETDWLGAVVERGGSTLFVSAEEDIDVLQFRIDAVARQVGTTLANLDGVKFHCLPSDDAVLGLPDAKGIVRPTDLFLRLEQTIKEQHPVLVILESAADIFAVDENNRNHARQSIGLLRRLCKLPSNPSVLLIAHPSLSGLQTGRGTSGSTGWHNSVRARLYFSSPSKKSDEDDDADDTARVLEMKKSNYGPSGEKVKVRWDRGVYVMAGMVSSFTQVATERQVEDAFLRCLDTAGAQGIDVSPKPGRNSAWKVFAGMPEAAPFKERALELAMRRLLSAGKIRAITVGSKSREKSILVRSEGGE